MTVDHTPGQNSENSCFVINFEDKKARPSSLGKLLLLSTQTQPGSTFDDNTMASKMRNFKMSS